MKSRFLLTLGYFALLTFLFSCGDDENGGTKAYFIKFKVNGESKIFQVNDPGYQSCGNCACSSIPPFTSDYGDINICNDADDWITPAHIEGWENSSIGFSGAGFPIASFYFTLNGVSYSTEYASSQTGSVVTITSVTPDGDLFDLKMFKVKGTFNCNVRADGGLSDIAITEGSFVVRYSED